MKNPLFQLQGHVTPTPAYMVALVMRWGLTASAVPALLDFPDYSVVVLTFVLPTRVRMVDHASYRETITHAIVHYPSQENSVMCL